jgi:spore coat protein CotF
MYTTYHLSSAQELSNIVDSIKSAYKSKPITVTVEEELDATAYLMSTPTNKAVLKKSLEEAKNGNLIEVKIKD